MGIPDTEPVYFLLVDDREENLLSLEGLLRREGLVLLKASCGTEALELLLLHDVALAILDVQMPGMDGFELAEFMRGSERSRRVPIIFLTAGNADRQRRFRGYEAGAVDFLHKPIEPDILRSKAEVFYELYLQRQQLSHQRDALELADHRKNEFLAVLAHELRNPLTPIRFGLDMMRMSPDRPVSSETQAMMDRQLTHLVRLIDDLMDVSRISQGKIDLRLADVTVQSALQNALESTRQLFESRGHSLTQKIPLEPLWLHADATRIVQVLSNLLNNAAKYTPDGGQIDLSVAQIDRTVVISIKDDGIGVPEEMLSQIFDLFTQVQKPGERSPSGLGIGLALARQLVELHRGSLTASSAGLSSGSTFTLQLPLRDSDTQLIPEHSQHLQKRSSLKVLVVDDNITSAETTGQILAMVGHHITLAHNGSTALEIAEKLNPEVIILDIGMPEMNGYEVCRALRSNPLFAQTLIIAQTGWGQDKDRQNAEVAGFDHHLTKPVDFRVLSDLLAQLPNR